MDRQELAQYSVAHRDTPEGEAAWKELCRRFRAKARAAGIETSSSDTEHRRN